MNPLFLCKNDTTASEPTTASASTLRERESSELLFSAAESFRTVFSQIVRMALAIHLLLLCAFLALDVATLVYVNVASVLLYALCMWLMRRKREHCALFVACTEVIVHSLIATIVLGWFSGFPYYLLVLPPLLFLSDLSVKFCVVSVVTLALGYVQFNILFAQAVPVDVVPDQILSLLRYVNISVTIATIGTLSYMYRANVTIAVARLQKLAATDPLTGLTNRREFFRRATLQTPESRKNPLYSLILCDIDNFKRINDTHGHEAGDRLLLEVCRVLRESSRDIDLLTRWGGEEFVLMLPGADLDTAQRVADRARWAILGARIRMHSDDRAVTLTFGVAERRGDEDVELCIARADAALNIGKRQGKDRVMLAQSADDNN